MFRGESSNVLGGEIVHTANVNFVRNCLLGSDVQRLLNDLRSLINSLWRCNNREFLVTMLAV